MEKQEIQYVNAEGKFLGTVKQPGNGWLGESNGGSEFVRVPIIVDAGPEAGKEIVWKGYTTEKARRRTLETLNDVFGTDWTFAGLITNKVQWAGTLVSVSVKAEEYNGETRYKAQWLNPAQKPVEASTVDSLDRALAAIRSGAVPAVVAAAAADVEGDEIPF
jgi:hypothetical protein